MNWLDIILIIGILITFIGGLILSVLCHKDGDTVTEFVCFIVSLFFTALLVSPFIVIDKWGGVTMGTITSVDKNFFGTTSLYIKTSETTQEKYCIEFNKDLEDKAKELIGKEVKISYGERIGLYSTKKCNQAPVEEIEVLEK